jgi:hypothetical protein
MNNRCTSLKNYGNTKSEAILAMLDEKYKLKAIAENKGKSIPIGIENVLKQYMHSRKITSEYEKKLKKMAESSGYVLNTWDGIPKIVFNKEVCFIPKALIQKIQEAKNLASLGKREEARKILDTIIKEEGLI